MRRFGFELFVAWRYLREEGSRRRHSPDLLLNLLRVRGRWTLVAGLLMIIGAVVMHVWAGKIAINVILDSAESEQRLKQGLMIGSLVSLALGVLVLLFGFFHALQSIFTTISTFGVFLGVAALVIVLSVMNGFETDLRQKILGSNAHMLITKENGSFTEWRDVEARIDQACSGNTCVVAHTPYVSSEVVVAANSNYQSVIIKGIDPVGVGKVTDLKKNLTKDSALDRLWPMTPEGKVLPYKAPPADDDTDVEPTDFSAPPTPTPAPAPPPPVVDDREPIDFSGGPDAGPHYETLVLPRHHSGGPPKTDPRVAGLDGLLVGRELAKNLHLYSGEEVQVVSPLGKDTPTGQVPRTKPFRVAGTFFSGMYEYDTKFVYVTMPALQGFLSLGDEATGIEIKASDIDNTQALVAMLQDRLGPAYRVQDWKELNRNLFSALKLEKIAMFLVLTIIILVASFSIVSNLIMLVVEKAREIAIFKSMGASDRAIMRVFIFEGVYIGLLGTVFGLIVGIGTCWALKTYGLPLDPDVYYIDKLPVAMDPIAIVGVAFAGVLISVIATIYPSYIAARLRPVDGLRYE